MNKKIILYGVCLMAIVYLFFLASGIRPDVFFQGDGGMKFMVVKQLNAGLGFKYLSLPEPDWVKQIWNDGFFPIKKPFLYPSREGYIVSFPPGFQLVSALAYGKFGYRGLYILPIFSTILLWGWVVWLLLRAGVREDRVAVALFLLAFCSPLTIYGVTYWEHMPAVCCLFSGIVFIVLRPRGWLGPVFFGLVCGLAVWMRPEALLLDLLYGLAAVAMDRHTVPMRRWFGKVRPESVAFLAGMCAMVATFFIFNKLSYGSLLGVHGSQVFDDHTFGYKFLRGIKYGLVLNWLLIKFFPFYVLVVVAFAMWWKNGQPPVGQTRWLLHVIGAFAILSPFMFPNTGGGQWGPRYFLPLVPLIVVTLGLAAEGQQEALRFSRFGSPLKVFLVAAAGYCVFINTWRAGEVELRRGYANRITPALAFVRAHPGEAVVVNTEHISMEMGAIFQERNFFLAEDSTMLTRLVSLLRQQGQDRFLYINENDSATAYPNLLVPGGMLKQGRYFFGEYSLK